MFFYILLRTVKTLIKLSITLLLLLSVATTYAQRGKIITPATPATNPMDPNGDGWVTKNGVPFSNDGIYTDEFEFQMFGIPKLGGDVTGDNTGQPCGITDLIPDHEGYSVYAVRDANNNLVFRFRVGNNNPSVEAWTILMDVDGLFGANDPNATADNPGFELDITLIKRNNAGILVYNIDGVDNCPQPILNYPISSNFQIAIADEVSCGDPDYFYDFYVPFSDIANALTAAGITLNETTGMRYAAVTNVSATCAMDGKIADISGVDYDEYGNCVTCAWIDLIEAQCPTAVVDLCETCLGFSAGLPVKPTINTPVRAGQTSLRGGLASESDEVKFIRVFIFSRIGGTDEAPVWDTTPREEHVVPVTETDTTLTWIAHLDGPLQAYDRIVARSQLNFEGTGCGSADGNEASIEVTVVEPNEPPVAQDKDVEVVEDTPKDFILVASDPDGDPITFIIVSQPLHGTLSGTGPNFTYTPDQDYFGPDSFTYQVSDGVLLSNIATVTINVLPVNDAPIANDDAFTIDEDTVLNASVATNDSDVDGPEAVYTVVSGPTNGNLILNPNGTFTYTPNTNYFGTDQFVYSLCDNGTPNLCDNATVTITINSINDAPIANDDAFVTDEDTPLTASVAGNDDPTDGPQAVYTLVSGASNGTVILNPNGTFTYTPNLNFNGVDQFVYQLCDNGIPNLCDNATVTITVNPVNDAPIANDDAFAMDENTVLNASVAGNDSDVDGPEAIYTVVTGPTNGILTLNPNGTFTYTPNQDYSGTDQFVYSLCDNGTPNLCDQATVTITINPVNDPPIAVDDVFVTDEDVPLIASVAGNDNPTDGPQAIYTVVSGPSNGTLLLNPDGSFTYTPNPNYFGSDQFVYSLCDNGVPNLCDQATVSITVNPVNDPPVITGSFAATAYIAGGVTIDPTLVVTDVDDVNLTGVVISISNNFITGDLLIFVNQNGITGSYNPATGVLTLTGVSSLANYTAAIASIIYQNDDGTSFLTRRITFVASDGKDNSLPWNSFIDFPGNNGGPILNENEFVTNEDVPLVVCLDVTDPDGDGVNISSFTNSSGNGIFTLNGGVCFTFTPNANFNGTVTADVTLCDTGDPSICLTYPIIITVLPVNDAPVANNQVVTVIEDTPKEIILTATDVDNAQSELIFTIVTQPLHGILTGSGTTYTYTPNLDYTGPDSFTFIVNDGQLNSQVATVSINVIPVNDPPIAVDDVFETLEDTPLNANVADNDSDVDGPDAIYTVVTGPSHGILVLNPNGTFTYTPNLNYFGQDQFEYQLCDNGTPNLCDNAIVTINVLPVNDPPVIISQIIEIDEDNSVTICIEFTDVEGDPAEISSLISQGNSGTIIFPIPVTPGDPPSNPGLCFIYIPNPDFNGQDIIDVTLCDVNDPTVCGGGTITIIVKPVNDKPIIIVGGVPVDTLFLTTPEDIDLSFCFTTLDVDGDDTVVDAFFNVTGGGLLVEDASGINQHCFTFSPVPDFNGDAIWNLTVCDDVTPSLCTTLIIVIDVTPVDDPPIAVDDLFETDEDVVLNADVSLNDINDGPQANYTLLTGTSNGVVVLNPNGTFTYTPAPNYNGPDQFTYRLCDGSTPVNQCDDAIVSITVRPVNDPPVIAPFPVLQTKEDSLLRVCVSVIDVDGDVITYLPATNVKGGGTMVLETAPFDFCYIFTPPLNYNGEAIWNISVSDGTVTVSAPVKIIVLPVNDPPVAFNDYYTVRSGVDTTFNVLTNDLPIVAPFKEFYDIYEADSVDQLVLVSFLAGPYHGTASFQPNGVIQYKSNFGYMGPDSIRYRMRDSSKPVYFDTAVVFIEVAPAPFKIYETLSPNNDGFNDYWRIDGIEKYPNNRIRIFDRYGNMVFQTSGYANEENSWKGQANHGLIGGNLPEGTYYYAVELGDGSAVLSGYVVIKLK
jgi:large repetitive protein